MKLSYTVEFSICFVYFYIKLTCKCWNNVACTWNAISTVSWLSRPCWRNRPKTTFYLQTWRDCPTPLNFGYVLYIIKCNLPARFPLLRLEQRSPDIKRSSSPFHGFTRPYWLNRPKRRFVFKVHYEFLADRSLNFCYVLCINKWSLYATFVEN